MEAILTQTLLFETIRDGDKILKGKPFIIIDGQILFFQDQLNHVVFSNISDEENYTFEDYMQLPENAPFQLINGKLIYMAAPSLTHQDLVGNIYYEIKTYLKTNTIGRVWVSPVDVKFDRENVFQPDVVFVSIKKSGILDRFINGAPDFVVEILSQKNKSYNLINKKEVYGRFKVKEYWIVYPEDQQIEVFHNRSSKMNLVQTAGKNDKIKSKAIKGFELEVSKIFE
jgi:Uma2 family endonuclease